MKGTETMHCCNDRTVLIRMQVYQFKYARQWGGGENHTLIAHVTSFSGQVFLVRTNPNCDTCQLLLYLS